MRTHTEEKPLSCYKCDRSFHDMFHLKRHQAETHNLEKHLTRSQCDSAFAKGKELKNHQGIHKVEKVVINEKIFKR